MPHFGEQLAPPFPEKDKTHQEVEVKILEIKDAWGNAIKDGSNEYDSRQFAVDEGKRTIVKYEIKNQEALVFGSIYIDPGNKVAKDYYRDPLIEMFPGNGSPGTHTIEWDGRTTARGRRVILQGEYKVSAEAICIECGHSVKDEAKIKVKKPYAHAYGAKYPPNQYKPPADDLTRKAAHVRQVVQSLPDGSGFEVGGTATDTAHTALNDMREMSALWYWDGHAAPGIIAFYDAAFHNTCIVSDNAIGKNYNMSEADLAEVAGLPDGSLKDVFLVLLSGCYTANTPPGSLSLPDALTAKGVNLVLAFKKGIPSGAAEKWNKDFFDALRTGKGILKAARIARSKAQSWAKANLAFTITSGGGAGANEKLLPARYGRGG